MSDMTPLHEWRARETMAYKRGNPEQYAHRLADYAETLEKEIDALRAGVVKEQEFRNRMKEEQISVTDALQRLWVEVRCDGEEPVLNPHYIVARAIAKIIELREELYGTEYIAEPEEPDLQ